jgi:sigma-B regulation protein RsbU (phosphoserine phosphatase)
VTHSLVRIDRRLAQIRGLTELSRALTYTISFDEVLQLTVHRAADLLDSTATVLMLVNDDGVITFRASVGAIELGAPRADLSVVDHLQQALGVTAERFLAVPLVVGGDVTGLLAVALPEGRAADDQEWLLSALADQAAVALEKSRLDERGRFRDRLIGIVSHDLRNPLNTILLGASILLGGEELTTSSLKTVTRMQAAAERAERMISDILDYTQAHLGGGIRVDRKVSNLGPIFRQVLDELEVSHPEHDFELEVSGDTNAEFDADRIGQVLGNLLSNAVNYGVADTRIRVELRGEESAIAFTVHNVGSVIPPERLRAIFEPMQQVAPGSGRGRRSVGLGLYIVESIVSSHRGTISVTSTEADGTTFTVTIPRHALVT